jgi:hypothetical protein
MKKRLQIAFFIIALGILFLLRYIAREPSSILSVSNCLLPCWNSITPGDTTINASRRIMADSQITTEVTYYDYLQEVDFEMSFDSLNMHKVNGRISSDNGIVSIIWIAGWTQVTLNDVIEQNGFPEYIISTKFGGGGNTLEVISKMVNWRSNPSWERANGPYRRTMGSGRTFVT